jgi:hypothetical protein
MPPTVASTQKHKSQMHCAALSSWTLTRHSNQILQSYPAPPPRGVRRDSHITSKKLRRYIVQEISHTLIMVSTQIQSEISIVV